ncbi:hypothetical protein, partial [Bacillus cereus group sp. BC309]|uniref:hypothetical protein n=1 Tax=Bacillus cereus group sp. BC309 TaxID=3445318 RepID=UPI003F259F48
IKAASVRSLAYMGVDATTSNRVYYFGPIALSSAFAGIIPKNHGLFVTHNTGVALNSTAGKHILSYTGIYATVI